VLGIFHHVEDAALDDDVVQIQCFKFFDSDPWDEACVAVFLGVRGVEPVFVFDEDHRAGTEDLAHEIRAGVGTVRRDTADGRVRLPVSVLLIGLSSLLIPVVLKQIDDRKAVDQQRLQAQLSRQDKILDAQAEVLDSLATSFWDYEGYAADLLYSRDERYGRDEWHQ